MSRNHGVEQGRLGKQKHPDVQRALGGIDRRQNGVDCVIRKNNKGVRHHLAPGRGQNRLGLGCMGRRSPGCLVLDTMKLGVDAIAGD